MDGIIGLAIVIGAAYLIYRAANKDSSSSPSGKQNTRSGNTSASHVQRTVQSTYSSPQASRQSSRPSNPQQADSKKDKYNLPPAY